jgi:Holliday junction resolvase RusA-like endonuclease
MRLDYFGKIVPKLRPKVNTKTAKAYNPPHYTAWKEEAKREFAEQWFGKPTLNSCHMRIIICGEHHTKDPDNLAGAILDALVQGKILKDDKIRNIPDLRITYRPELKIGTTVLIESPELGDIIGDDLHDFKR